MKDPRSEKSSRPRWAPLHSAAAALVWLFLNASPSSAAPNPILVPPNSSFMAPVPQPSSAARVVGGDFGWIQAGLPKGDSFRAREMDRDLQFRMMRALNEAEALEVTGRSSGAAKQGEYDRMKRMANEALSIVEKSQLDWHQARMTRNLKKSLPHDSVRTIENSVAVVGGVAAVGLGAPLSLDVSRSFKVESRTHLVDRTAAWKLFSPAGRSSVEVRLLDEGSQMQASHSYPLEFLSPGLSASVTSMRMIDGVPIPGVTDDDRVQLNYSIRF